ncbi:MAG: GGDEF domain-containing response regulator [Gammaproteobacteria bacterium]|nr:GGDEF domain-containing response regulator [Gammaproteobacteria bacterium]
MNESPSLNNNQMVYLLEDDKDDAYLISKALQSDHLMKHSVLTFDSLESIVNALKNLTPDIILMDLNVSDSDGFDTMLTVKQHALGVPIVVVTGIDDATLGDRLIQLGAQDYIPKSELSASLLQRVIRFSKERHLLLKALENSVNKDNLTKLYSRKALHLKIEELIDHARRYEDSFALLFVDLDNFKPVNDIHGHDAGDQLLQHIANRLHMFSRSTDFVARYGGDEFVTVLPHIKSLNEAQQAGKQQLKSICGDYFVTDLQGKAQKVEVSASMGYAIYEEHGTTATDLLKAADEAMYDVKVQKKN